MRARFNISVAEVDDHEVWQKGTIGVVACSNEAKHVRSLLDQIVMQVRLHPVAELLDHEIEIL